MIAYVTIPSTTSFPVSRRDGDGLRGTGVDMQDLLKRYTIREVILVSPDSGSGSSLAWMEQALMDPESVWSRSTTRLSQCLRSVRPSSFETQSLYKCPSGREGCSYAYIAHSGTSTISLSRTCHIQPPLRCPSSLFHGVDFGNVMERHQTPPRRLSN